MKLPFQIFLEIRHLKSIIIFYTVIIFFIFVSSFVNGSILAGPSNIYSVTDVNLDVTAVSSVNARDSAFSDGHKRALKIIYDRLVLREDIQNLPINNLVVEELITDFQLSDERVSPTRYRAKLAVTFSQKAVRQHLMKYLVRFAESQSDGIIILPVMIHHGKVLLWSEPNPWREIWAERKKDISLLPILSPLGDISDISQIKDSNILDASVEVLKEFATRYDVKQLVVATIEDLNANSKDLTYLISSVIGDNKDTVSLSPELNMLEKRKNKIETYFPKGGMRITLRHISPDGEYFREIKVRSDGSKSTKLFYQQMLEAVVELIREEWKNSNLLRFDQENELHVTVPIDHKVSSWIAILKRLKSLPVVVKIDIVELSTGAVKLIVGHLGDIDQLSTALNTKQLELNIDELGWKIESNIGVRETQ